MKADLRISVKDYHRNKNLKILLHRTPFPSRQFMFRMNGSPWPKTGLETTCHARASRRAQAVETCGIIRPLGIAEDDHMVVTVEHI